MRGAPSDYVRVGSVEEAVQTLDQANGEGRILAGGQSLTSVLALRKARPAVLVDVNRIPGLAMIRPGADPSGSVEVGALVRHSMLVGQTDHPLLAEAARWIGHARTRSPAHGLAVMTYRQGRLIPLAGKMNLIAPPDASNGAAPVLIVFHRLLGRHRLEFASRHLSIRDIPDAQARVITARSGCSPR